MATSANGSRSAKPMAREVEDKSSLFEACKNGDLERVASLLTSETVNSRDIAGRKSTPLHFAAGMWFLCSCISLSKPVVVRVGGRCPGWAINNCSNFIRGGELSQVIAKLAS